MKITGTGRFAPITSLSNDDLSKLVDTNNEWITTRTGIKKRHISTSENTSDLAFKAAVNAMDKAGVKAEQIDLIIVATFTPDAFLPSVASMVQEKLGIKQAMAFDINAACSGFIYGLTIAKNLMLSKVYQCALVIGAETISKVIDWQDRDTCILFGDGAGAVVLQHTREEGLLYEYCAAKPDLNHDLITGGVPLTNPLFKADHQDYFIHMQGQNVFKFAISAATASIQKVLTETGLTINDINYIVCHQANYRIIKKIAKTLSIPEAQFFMNLDEYGNTSAASIPIALDEMVEIGLLQAGMNIILVGFGAGLTWGASLIKW